MKNILIALLFLTTVACSDNENYLGTENFHISTDEIKNYLPSEYKTVTKTVFVNASGEQKTMISDYVATAQDRVKADTKYKTDDFEIEMFDTENHNLRILIMGSANLDSNGEIRKLLSLTLMPLTPGVTTLEMISFKDNEPVIGLASSFTESKEYLGKSFKDVFVTIAQYNDVRQETYSEMAFNSEFGIVAFRDEADELWVFEKFEK